MVPVPLTYLNYIQFRLYSDPGIFPIPGASAHRILGITERVVGEAKSQHGAGLLTLIPSSLQCGNITDPPS